MAKTIFPGEPTMVKFHFYQRRNLQKNIFLLKSEDRNVKIQNPGEKNSYSF